MCVLRNEIQNSFFVLFIAVEYETTTAVFLLHIPLYANEVFHIPRVNLKKGSMLCVCAFCCCCCVYVCVCALFQEDMKSIHVLCVVCYCDDYIAYNKVVAFLHFFCYVSCLLFLNIVVVIYNFIRFQLHGGNRCLGWMANRYGSSRTSFA